MRILSVLAITGGLALGIASLWAQNPGTSEPQKSGTPVQAQQAQQAQTFTGTLVDANCKTVNSKEPCEITEATKTFGLQTPDGKFLKFDDSGNSKVRAALDGSPNKTGSIKALLKGEMDGNTLMVNAVEIQH
jgi:hypothetical protein